MATASARLSISGRIAQAHPPATRRRVGISVGETGVTREATRCHAAGGAALVEMALAKCGLGFGAGAAAGFLPAEPLGKREGDRIRKPAILVVLEAHAAPARHFGEFR